MKDILVAYSCKNNVLEIIEDIKNQFAGSESQVLIYFSSSNIDQVKLASELQKAFYGTVIFGCSTAGEILSGKMMKNSVVAMGFFNNIIEDISVEVIEDIKDRTREEIENKIKSSFTSFEKHFSLSPKDMDFRNYVGMILLDGLSMAEEGIMDVIGDLTDVIFIGASAGDDLKFKETFVYKDGIVYTNAAVLAIIKPKRGFDFIKTQSFRSRGNSFIASNVNEKTRTVMEFNNKPAVHVYAEALGVPVDLVKTYFMTNPIGLMISGEPYVRSPQQIVDESMVFYCNIVEGMELELLESTDIIEDTKKALLNKLNEVGSISGIINFHCILRTLELEKKGLSEKYGAIFEKIPTIGFSTYGEEYLGHINQTSTMLIFK